jgi:hypothetical protein
LALYSSQPKRIARVCSQIGISAQSKILSQRSNMSAISPASLYSYFLDAATAIIGSLLIYSGVLGTFIDPLRCKCATTSFRPHLPISLLTGLT